MQRDSVPFTIGVAVVLCIVCSVLVSAAAVLLRPMQITNRKLEKQRNVLLAAGLLEPGQGDKDTIREAFQQVRTRVVDLETGEYVDPEDLGLKDLNEYDQRKSAKDPNLSVAIPASEDFAGIRRREKYSEVYLVEDPSSGEIEQIVFPVYGRGLWSTLYGFVALDRDLMTIRGLTFYEHGETPGLGGEVDNEGWKASWRGKQAFNPDWNVAIDVVRGRVDQTSSLAMHQIDGLSGATITSQGVEGLLKFWLGPGGFGPFLEKLREGGGNG